MTLTSLYDSPCQAIWGILYLLNIFGTEVLSTDMWSILDDHMEKDNIIIWVNLPNYEG